MSVSIFGSGSNNMYDIARDLDLNNNTIRNVKNPEDDHDVTNKQYVDAKLVSNNGWALEGNTLLADGKIGSLNEQSFTLVRNNIPQMKFSPNGIIAYNHIYMEREIGGYIGMSNLNANREFGIFFGNNKNMITWKNQTTQPLRFLASSGYLFLHGRHYLFSMDGVNGLQIHKNIDMLTSNRIINLKEPVNASDCATKAYSDLKVLKNGDTMTGNLYFDGSTRNIHIGCNNSGTAQGFRLYLGSESNKINGYNNDIDIFAGRAITISAGTVLNIITINSSEITFRKPLSMANFKIVNVAPPEAATDAANKQYVDTKYEELNARLQRLESRT